jgi:hypothetical protein
VSRASEEKRAELRRERVDRFSAAVLAGIASRSGWSDSTLDGSVVRRAWELAHAMALFIEKRDEEVAP